MYLISATDVWKICNSLERYSSRVDLQLGLLITVFLKPLRYLTTGAFAPQRPSGVGEWQGLAGQRHPWLSKF
jgi:hypothetical protein